MTKKNDKKGSGWLCFWGVNGIIAIFFAFGVAKTIIDYHFDKLDNEHYFALKNQSLQLEYDLRTEWMMQTKKTYQGGE